MPHAHVVGGERQPGAVGFLDAGRQPRLQVQQVAGAALDTLAGVETIGDAQVVGGAPGQHHQAAHAGVGRGFRVPVRFLVADRGQQAPIQPVGVGGLTEQRNQRRQAVAHLAHELVHADPVEALVLGVEGRVQRRQAAVLARLVHEDEGLARQAVVRAARKGPCVGQGARQREGDVDARVIAAVQAEDVRVDQGGVDRAVGDGQQQ